MPVKQVYRMGNGVSCMAFEREEKLLEEYLRTKIRRDKTREDYRKTIEEYDQAVFDKIGVRDAFFQTEEKEAQAYIDWLNDEHEAGTLRYSTIRKKLSTLSSMLEYIGKGTNRRGDYLAKYIAVYRSAEKKVEPLSVEEIDRLYGLLTSDIDRVLFLMMYKLGLKTTDLTGIGPKDIVKYKDRLCFCLKKENRSGTIRTTYMELTDDIAELLQKLPVKDGHYHTAIRRKPITSQYISFTIKNLGREAGIDGVTAMRIRRSGASLLYTLGGSPEDLAEHLGITQQWVQDYEDVVATPRIREAKLKHVKFVGDAAALFHEDPS